MQTNKNNLNGLTVLVTRPSPGGEALCQAILAADGEPIFFPTISFTPPKDTKLFQQQIANLASYDWLIFISPQAVQASRAEIHSQWPSLPADIKIVAVGAGTADALKKAKLPIAIYPGDDWSSAGILDLPEFQTLNAKKIAIIQGEGGREILAEALTKRAAVVTSIIAYRRTLPDVDVHPVIEALQTHQLDAVVCTSGTGLENLKKLLQPAWPQLQIVPVLVISPRLIDLAKKTGFKSVFLAKNASHSAIITSLSENLASQHQKGYRMENPANDTNIEPTVPSHPARAYSIWGSIGILFSTLAFIVLIGGLYLGYGRLIKSDMRLAALTQALNDKTQQDQNAIATLQKSLSDTQQNSQQLQAALNAQQQTLGELHTTQMTQDSWRVSEAQYLTTLANDNLQLGDNVPLVITLLQNADQKIRDLSDPKLVNVRKAIAADITALQAVPSVDLTGIYLQLVALNGQVDKLPLPTKRPETEQAQDVTTDKKVVWWRRGLHQTWDALRQIIIVRYNEGDQRPFIPPDQQEFIYQNLHAMFEQALTAAVHKQPEIYRASLAQATDWIKRYFLQDSPVTQALLNGLDQVQNQTLKPKLPDLSALQAFHDYFAANDSAPSPTGTAPSQQ